MVELEFELEARLADRERELGARRWDGELQRARSEQTVGSNGERLQTRWWGLPSLLWRLALPGRVGSP
jgi:hypothetical protein